jgi:hypothetical protein
MSEEQAALVRYRLGEAKETLEEARLLAREARWRGALNRVYYAMFYATLALLAGSWHLPVIRESSHCFTVSLSGQDSLQGNGPGTWTSLLISETGAITRILSPLMWYKLRNSLERLNLLSLKQSDSVSSF